MFRNKTGIPEPSTDLQSRLLFIENRCKEIEMNNKDNKELSELSYLVKYLAIILRIHLNTDEK